MSADDAELIDAEDDGAEVAADWRRYPPVWLPEDREPQGAVSQTFMQRFDLCRRSAFYYARDKGGAASHAMERGSGAHLAIARGYGMMIENGEPFLPPELAKIVVDEVLADPSLAIPLSEHDFIREQVYRWAGETAIEPERVLAVERLFVLELGPLALRCKIDYAERSAEGSHVSITDWKSSKAAVTQEEVTRTRPDGSRLLKAFQLVAYACAVVFGRPVDVVPCSECFGSGVERAQGSTERCPVCKGRGVYEVAAPMALAGDAMRVWAEFAYPAIPVGEERAILRRGGDLSRLELEQYLASLRALASQIADVVQSGDWRPVPGSHCPTCAGRWECPLPDRLKSMRTPVNGPEDAARVAQEWFARDAEAKALLAELRNWSKGAGGVAIPLGRDLELSWASAERTSVSRDELLVAAREAAEFGTDFELSDFVRRSQYTEFKKRKRDVEEEGSDVAV